MELVTILKALREAGYKHEVVAGDRRVAAVVWLKDKPGVRFLFEAQDVRALFSDIRRRLLS